MSRQEQIVVYTFTVARAGVMRRRVASSTQNLVGAEQNTDKLVQAAAQGTRSRAQNFLATGSRDWQFEHESGDSTTSLNAHTVAKLGFESGEDEARSNIQSTMDAVDAMEIRDKGD